MKRRKFALFWEIYCRALEMNKESNSLREFLSPSTDIIAKPT